MCIFTALKRNEYEAKLEKSVRNGIFMHKFGQTIRHALKDNKIEKVLWKS